ncbi:MAG: beta-ketoacyl-ACP synthase II [Gemmatimonadota bacterium]|nr:beta-ketoacyl-ACP synthase II [Gemmatimonadota bacterium]
MPRRVVVTGLGVVSPLGLNLTDTWAGLLAGRSGAARIKRFDPTPMEVQFGCEVKDFDPLPYVDRKEAKRYDLFLQYAIAAASQAMQDAGLGERVPEPERAGVIIGSGIGGIGTFEEQCKISLTAGPKRVSAFFVPMFIPDIASGVISIRTGAKGPNYCTVSACASSAHALGEAFRLIQSGETDVMISGGAEAAITPLAVAGFSNMKALSGRNDEPERASRPFDRDRDGFVMGDGAGILILEALDHAQARGARIYAEMLGYGMSADAYHITQPAPGGEGAKRAMLAALRDANLDRTRVDYINTHGTSTPHGDVAEVKAIKDVFGPHAYKVVAGSTKSMTGHLLGAAGGLEMAISVLTLVHGKIPPTINVDNPDPECDLDCAANQAVERSVDVALSNSFGFGGHNVSLLVGRYRN